MTPRAKIYPFRANEEDREVMDWLQQRLGVSAADVVRLGIRALKKAEERKDK
jgi:hypothetical protein